MKTSFTAMTLAIAILGAASSLDAFAQSEAESEAYQAVQEPLEPGSGVTATDDQIPESGSGRSDAMSESLDNVRNETDGQTSIPDAQALDELSSEGQSDAAAEAIESQ